MESRSLIVVFSAGLLLAACKHPEAAEPEAHAGAVEPKTPPVKVHVTTVAVTEQKVPKYLRLTGKLASGERTELAANATGRVVKTLVERGDHVAKGAVLAQLDIRAAALSQAEAAANMQSASASLANAKADCLRFETLLAKGAITQQEYDKQHTACETQAAGAEAAKVRAAEASQTISDSSIRAPFGGLIAERFVHVGDYVRPDSKVVTLLVDDPLRLELTVPEANVSSVRPGVVVSFETVAVPGRSFNATVKYMGGEIREATRDLVAEAITSNGEHLLLPGMFVPVRVPVGEITLPVVPDKALAHHDDGSDSVFVVIDDHLVERIVQLGPKVGDVVAIVDGVKKDEQVVVSPPAGSADGVEVE